MSDSCRSQDELIQALLEREERYRSVTETSVDGIVTSNDEDRILTWNKGAQTIFGFGPEIVGGPVTQIIPEQYREAHRQGISRFLKKGERHIIGKQTELEALDATGQVFPIELTLSTWTSGGRTFFGAIIRDISERKKTERLQNDVHRIMRHDLKSPLVGIIGAARLLRKGRALDEKQQKAVNLIEDLGEKMLRFIGRARDLFLMEQGRYDFSPETADLSGIIAVILDQLAPLIQGRNLAVEYRIQGRDPDWGEKYLVQGEPGLLEIMLANLLKNAIEASPKDGKIRIEVDRSEMEGRVGHEIRIHNQGVVPKEVRPRFFEPYATFGKKDGTGLGTHSARLIARTHQGDITFSTSKTQGTWIRVHLPLEIKPKEDSA